MKLATSNSSLPIVEISEKLHQMNICEKKSRLLAKNGPQVKLLEFKFQLCHLLLAV